jgi:hypothetical protein
MRRSWRARAAVIILLVMVVGTAVFVGLFVGRDDEPACGPFSGELTLRAPGGGMVKHACIPMPDHRDCIKVLESGRKIDECRTQATTTATAAATVPEPDRITTTTRVLHWRCDVTPTTAPGSTTTVCPW